MAGVLAAGGGVGLGGGANPNSVLNLTGTKKKKIEGRIYDPSQHGLKGQGISQTNLHGNTQHLFPGPGSTVTNKPGGNPVTWKQFVTGVKTLVGGLGTLALTGRLPTYIKGGGLLHGGIPVTPPNHQLGVKHNPLLPGPRPNYRHKGGLAGPKSFVQNPLTPPPIYRNPLHGKPGTPIKYGNRPLWARPNSTPVGLPTGTPVTVNNVWKLLPGSRGTPVTVNNVWKLLPGGHAPLHGAPGTPMHNIKGGLHNTMFKTMGNLPGSYSHNPQYKNQNSMFKHSPHRIATAYDKAVGIGTTAPAKVNVAAEPAVAAAESTLTGLNYGGGSGLKAGPNVANKKGEDPRPLWAIKAGVNNEGIPLDEVEKIKKAGTFTGIPKKYLTQIPLDDDDQHYLDSLGPSATTGHWPSVLNPRQGTPATWPSNSGIPKRYNVIQPIPIGGTHMGPDPIKSMTDYPGKEGTEITITSLLPREKDASRPHYYKGPKKLDPEYAGTVPLPPNLPSGIGPEPEPEPRPLLVTGIK